MEERERLFNVLRSIDYLEPFPSQANFILCKVSVVFRCRRTPSALPAARAPDPS